MGYHWNNTRVKGWQVESCNYFVHYWATDRVENTIQKCSQVYTKQSVF